MISRLKYALALLIGLLVITTGVVAVTRPRSPADNLSVAIPPPPVPPPSLPLPAAVNLQVPFTPQAPYANWDPLHEEACEESAVVMAMAWVAGEPATLIAPAEAERRIQALVAWQNQYFGTYLDTTATQTADIIRGFYGYTGVKVRTDVTAASIKAELAAGRLVLVPAAGRLLGNPHFTPPGPWYHMLVIRGYGGGNFITNDGGIKEGMGWTYREDILLNAIHDWTGVKEQIATGPRAMIVVQR